MANITITVTMENGDVHRFMHKRVSGGSWTTARMDADTELLRVYRRILGGEVLDEA